MSEYRSSGRTAPRNYDSRSAGSRPPQNRRPAPQGSRPPQGRPPQRRKKKKGVQPRFFIILAVLLIIVVAAVVLLSGGSDRGTTQPKATPTVQPQTNQGSATVYSASPTAEPGAEQATATAANTGAYTPLAELLANEDSDLVGLSAEQMVQVSDLSINTALPEEWINVLLLGTDNRSLAESSRTDTMIICSVNRNTGEVKLTNIMRDLAVHYDQLPEGLSASMPYRINAAHYFGGPEYAMKTVNECFDLNIQHYASVNFYGFKAIVDALGGVDIDINEAEMNEINRLQVQQAKQGYDAGVDNIEPGDHLLETYGEDTHLNGRQALAYARIRKIDSDYVRQDRQRTVLRELLQGLYGKNVLELASLIKEFLPYCNTNLSFDDILVLASAVLNSADLDFETFRLPVTGSYVQETRNNDSMLYDCDWAKNSLELYNFIYE